MGGNCHRCGKQYIDRDVIWVCEEGCTHNEMPHAFCEECYLKANQWPSEATLASDREARLQSEIRSLAESETCANQQRVETEDEARERAELRHEISEVDAEVREQHEELQNVIIDNELRLSILEAEVREVRREQQDAEHRHQQSNAEARTFIEANQQEGMDTADRVEAAWNLRMEEMDPDASEQS